MNKEKSEEIMTVDCLNLIERCKYMDSKCSAKPKQKQNEENIPNSLWCAKHCWKVSLKKKNFMNPEKNNTLHAEER